MASEINPQKSGAGTFLSAAVYFFAFAIVVVLWVWRAGPKEGYEDKRGSERLTIRQEVIKAADEKLASAALADPAKGIARVSIADAKKSVVADLKAKKVGPSPVKVDPWLPMPPPADPKSTEPPTPALTSAPQGADTIRFETAPSK